MSTIHVEIKNLAQIRSAFSRAPQLMATELDKAIAKTAITIQGETQLNVGGSRGIRIVTGGLKGAVQRMVTLGHLKATLFPNIEYAGYVHNGTRFMRGRPFLLNAVDSKQQDTDKFFTEAVDNVLKKIGDMV